MEKPKFATLKPGWHQGNLSNITFLTKVSKFGSLKKKKKQFPKEAPVLPDLRSFLNFQQPSPNTS